MLKNWFFEPRSQPTYVMQCKGPCGYKTQRRIATGERSLIKPTRSQGRQRLTDKITAAQTLSRPHPKSWPLVGGD